MASYPSPNAEVAALYARYSSDLQSAASIGDQLRMCAEWAAKQGLLVAGSYTDQGVSGASLIRPGIQKLLQDAAAGKVDVIVTESLDRLSRDQEDIAHIYKRMLFQGVRIATVSEGEVNELHIGLKGTMGSALPQGPGRQDAACLRGRIEAGKSGAPSATAMIWSPVEAGLDRLVQAYRGHP
jgi:site-specific DNA recombinase